ncbi:putative Mg(2+) transport ATPase [Planctomycetes bacterium Pan216]|uniref:Putative Mg(2+) transport ATPase n=1 Tax=Kolteria novifilia TaxID=2527975 RepID=A0A518B6Z5_9BACT|nr:putative Mg(2+) transport ATPase [Planctomycetes bacterium Pan216]
MEWSEFGRVALAAGLGAIVGLEREIRDKPAGLRTHILVGAGSALLLVLGSPVIAEFKEQGEDFVNSDPIRVMQAIIVGISVLGAGTIFHEGAHRVEGLTTAASIFLTAGIGIAVGVGKWPLALGTTMGAFVVLFVVGWIERLCGRNRDV